MPFLLLLSQLYHFYIHLYKIENFVYLFRLNFSIIAVWEKKERWKNLTD